MSLQRLTLVLNASYEAINIVSARRAITMVLKGKARVEEPSKYFIRSGRMPIQIPSVIKLEEYRRVPHQNHKVTRKAILLRDRFSCQYCGTLAGGYGNGLTLDHIIPRSRQGQNTWENLVACCHRCNHRKANRTPEEAGMQLLHKPARIGIHAKHRLLATGQDSAWDKFLFV